MHFCAKPSGLDQRRGGNRHMCGSLAPLNFTVTVRNALHRRIQTARRRRFCAFMHDHDEATGSGSMEFHRKTKHPPLYRTLTSPCILQSRQGKASGHPRIHLNGAHQQAFVSLKVFATAYAQTPDGNNPHEDISCTALITKPAEYADAFVGCQTSQGRLIISMRCLCASCSVLAR